MTPKWMVVGFLLVSGLSYAKTLYTATGCVDSTGNTALDRTTATAMAKGQLAHELGGLVSAKSQLKTVTTETKDDVQTKDVLTESVTLKSEHMMKGVQTLEEGVQDITGTKKYCVRLGLST